MLASDADKFQNRWIRWAGPDKASSYSAFHTSHSLWSPLSGVSSRQSRRIFRVAAPLPGKLPACWKRMAIIWKTPIHSERQSKHSTRSLLVQKCKYRPCHHHHAGSCNLNQSLTEALPVGPSRAAAWRGGRRHRDHARLQTGSRRVCIKVEGWGFRVEGREYN